MQNDFPKTKATFILPGVAGDIEVATSWPEATTQTLAVICHPHPLFQGAMDNKVVTTIARACDQCGMPTLRFNFRGVGKSQGEHGDGIAEQQDLLDVIAWAQAALPGYRICLAGFSFGSYVAAAVAQQVKPCYLISVAPPVHHYDYLSLGKMKCPWLVIQGDQDEIVPFNQVQDWASSQGDAIELVIMPGVGHFFHGQLIKLKEILMQKLLA